MSAKAWTTRQKTSPDLQANGPPLGCICLLVMQQPTVEVCLHFMHLLSDYDSLKSPHLNAARPHSTQWFRRKVPWVGCLGSDPDSLFSLQQVYLPCISLSCLIYTVGDTSGRVQGRLNQRPQNRAFTVHQKPVNVTIVIHTQNPIQHQIQCSHRGALNDYFWLLLFIKILCFMGKTLYSATNSSCCSTSFFSLTNLCLQ